MVVRMIPSINWSGITHAVGGRVEGSGQAVSTGNGAIIEYPIRLNGSNQEITFDPKLFPESSDLTFLLQ